MELYQKAIGELRYIADGTRPDIFFITNRLAAACHYPTTRHCAHLKFLARHLKHTIHYRILYRCHTQSISTHIPNSKSSNDTSQVMIGGLQSKNKSQGLSRLQRAVFPPVSPGLQLQREAPRHQHHQPQNSSRSCKMDAAKTLLFEEDENEAFAASFWFQMASIALLHHRRTHGGSLPGKAANVYRDYSTAHFYYMVKYFCSPSEMRPGTNQREPQQNEKAFERRFRMPRNVFNTLIAKVVLNCPYMQQGMRPDATGRIGISPLLKVISALRELAYGLPADLADDLFDISETTASRCLEEFCATITKVFARQYLRSPTTSDIKNFERTFASAGFPGCIGCLDCAGWKWKNCPKALQGIMVGKEGEPSVRMEVICSLDLWIWSFQFGLPGAMNDLNILEVSDYFSRVLSGTFPPVTPSYTISGCVFDWFYYLTDGIYPNWKVFVKSLSTASDKKSKLYTRRQEGLRKCIERVFGVLFRRFKLLFIASEFWSVEKMQWLASACVCMHNMIVESRRNFYSSDGAGGRTERFNEREDTTDIVFEQCAPGDILLTGHSSPVISDNIKLPALNQRLVAALISHVWRQHGAET